MNTPAKAPLTRQQVIARSAELGIAVERLRFFDEADLAAGKAGAVRVTAWMGASKACATIRS